MSLRPARVLTKASFLALASFVALSAKAQTLTTLYTFQNNGDGYDPRSGVVSSGNMLYGTLIGSTAGSGSVFQYNLQTGVESTLYTFSGNADGALPFGGLLYLNGNLYGTTSGGGDYGYGTVFKVNAATGTETVLHSFGGPYATNGADGSQPFASLIYAGGYLYGTTEFGGTYDQGSIFKINPKTGDETTIHSFEFSEGDFPVAGVVYSGGSLYGTTSNDGPSGGGTVFRTDPISGETTVVHAFNRLTTDGWYSCSGLLAIKGSLYGTTAFGGTSYQGTIFKINLATGTETVLYNFTDGNDGGEPVAALTYRSGKFYGTALSGGIYGLGTVFSFNPATRTEKVLHTFGNSTDGGSPPSVLTYANGAFYGSTLSINPSIGGTNYGTIFAISP